jgi:hypothetical protein
MTALFLWLILTPLATCWLYRCWMRQNTWSYKLIQDRTNFQMIKADVTEGLVIVLVIAVSLIVIISFADFLRFHWVNDPVENQRRELRRELRQARQNNNNNNPDANAP